MANPLFSMLGGHAPQNGMSQMIKQFQEFKKTITGNPQDLVMQMLNNGQISQQQLNEAQAMANQLKDILN